MSMKTLKLDHELVELVISGNKTSTWRVHDDKNLSVGDEVSIVDKVDPKLAETWKVIGTVRIHRIDAKRIDEVTMSEMAEHGYMSTDNMVTVFKQYYGDNISKATEIKLLYFEVVFVQ